MSGGAATQRAPAPPSPPPALPNSIHTWSAKEKVTRLVGGSAGSAAARPALPRPRAAV